MWTNPKLSAIILKDKEEGKEEGLQNLSALPQKTVDSLKNICYNIYTR